MVSYRVPQGTYMSVERSRTQLGCSAASHPPAEGPKRGARRKLFSNMLLATLNGLMLGCLISRVMFALLCTCVSTCGAWRARGARLTAPAAKKCQSCPSRAWCSILLLRVFRPSTQFSTHEKQPHEEKKSEAKKKERKWCGLLKARMRRHGVVCY